MKKFYGLILGAVIGFVVVACGGSSGGAIADGTDTYSKTEVNAMIADLQTQIDAVNTGIVRVYAGGASTASNGMQKTSAPGTLVCGGALGHSPADQHAAQMQRIYCKSANGYIVGLPVTAEAQTVTPTPLGGRTLYMTNDCSGTAYTHWANIGALGLNNGIVFSYPEATGGKIGMAAPQASPINSRTFGSYFDENGACNAMSFSESNTIQIIANDPQATSVENSYTGPVLIE